MVQGISEHMDKNIRCRDLDPSTGDMAARTRAVLDRYEMMDR